MASVLTSGGSAPPAATPAIVNNPGSSSIVDGVEEVSGMHCPPISTLDRQYERPVGQRLLLFVRTNPNCCLQGGVETIIKLQKSNRAANRTNTRSSSKLTPSNSGTSLNALDESCGKGDQEDYPYTTESSTAKKGPNLGRFLKKVAKQTTATLERGMHELAIKADQGRSPDMLTSCIFFQGELVSMTDSVPMPRISAGVSFAIPLPIPPRIEDSSTLTVKLFIHSQASLIISTTGKSKTKHFLLGQTLLSVGQMRKLILQQRKGFFSLLLTSKLLADAQLHFCVLPDLKLPALGQRGWSLIDPRFSGLASAYNVPLDQSYLLKSTDQQWIVATERAIESTVVLPLASAYAKICARACNVSVLHAQAVANHLLAKRTEQKEPGHCARVQVELHSLMLDSITSTSTSMQLTSAVLTLAWQPPDSIFELELVPSITIPVGQDLIPHRHTTSPPLQTLKFFPPLCTAGVLPAILKAKGGRMPPSGYMLGNLRLQLPIPISGRQQELWEAIVVLEQHLQYPLNHGLNTPVQVPVYSLGTGLKMGTISMSLFIHLEAPASPVPPLLSPQLGLVSLVGLDSLIEGVTPSLDAEETLGNLSQQRTEEMLRRQHQLATMGSCMSHAYLDQHLRSRRQVDLARFQERAHKYQAAIDKSQHQSNPEHAGDVLPSWQDMSPRPFRPSSSRPEVLLSGIPFNTHNASISIDVLDPNSQHPQPDGAFFHNITCGAPADHASGFSNVFLDKTFMSPVGSVSGGLRRLEAKRYELAQVLHSAQTLLISGVANFFQSARQQQKFLNHVPARHSTLQNLRWKVFEAYHAYHHVTWICAVRRANAFSQAMGIAVSSYLSSLSDVAKCQLGWPDLWVRHGYLVCYEGLLSAAGKELGMIEDASVAISMLHMVRIVVVADEGSSGPDSEKVMVPHSPVVKWVHMLPSFNGANTQYLLQIGVHPHYFEQRIPSCLKNGTPVKLFPVLFQVGVDIRQWGAHAGSNVINQFAGDKESGGNNGGLLDDEDDDVGAQDDDVLVSLNYEALQKVNAYAHLISPLPGESRSSGNPFDAYTAQPGQSPQQQMGSCMSVHPSLQMLHGHIVTSAGKMNHSILDEAATMAQQLGGGGVVFCKSGKDRTAMHLTYKQAQFAHRFRQQRFCGKEMIDTTLEDATRMRIYGTRLPICEKNVGQALYAFNSLQSKFMPDALKPPPSTLSGFLKGGRVFGQGGIES